MESSCQPLSSAQIENNLGVPATPVQQQLLPISYPSYGMLPRSVHASHNERLVLLTVLRAHLTGLEARDTDAKTLHRRASLWDEVTEKFNESTRVKRSRNQVQTLYKNMKAKAKKYQLHHRGGGSSIDSDVVSEKLLEMLGQEQQQRLKQLRQAARIAFEGGVEDQGQHTQVLVDSDAPSTDVTKYLKQELLEPGANGCQEQPGNGCVKASKGDKMAAEHLDSMSTNANSTNCIADAFVHADNKTENISVAFDNESELTENKKLTNNSTMTLIPETSYRRDSTDISMSSTLHSPMALSVTAMKDLLDFRKDKLTSSRGSSDHSEWNGGASETNFKKRKLSIDIYDFKDTQKTAHSRTDVLSLLNRVSQDEPVVTDILTDSMRINSSTGSVCCNSMHDQILEIKRAEHTLFAQLQKKQLEVIEEEREHRRIEHELRRKLLERLLTEEVSGITGSSGH